jgi:YidC/Oxa1 family membrane protein insertase
MLALYHELLYRPLLNILVLLYDIFGDFGLAIIALTVIVRLILYPVAKKSLEHQKKLRKIQPHLKELQKKHKDDKEKLTQEMMALYKEHEFNPASGCLPLVVQFIILIALYRVFISGIHLDVSQLGAASCQFQHQFLGAFRSWTESR